MNKFESTTLTLTLSTHQDQARLSRILLNRSLTLSDAAIARLTLLTVWLAALLLVMDELIVSIYCFLFVGWDQDLPLIWAAIVDMWRCLCSNVR